MKFAVIILTILSLLSTVALESISGTSVAKASYNFDGYDKLIELAKDKDGNVNKFTLKPRSTSESKRFPTYMGKGLISQMAPGKPLVKEDKKHNISGYKFGSSMQFDIGRNEDIQFFIYYMIFPPGIGAYIDLKAKFTWNFLAGSDPYLLFELFATSGRDFKTGELQFKFFQDVEKITSHYNLNKLKKRYNKVLNAIKNSKDFTTDTSRALLSSTVEELWGDLKKKIDVKDNKKEKIPKQDLPKPEKGEIKKTALTENEMIYAYSDETTHMWVEGGILFMVDCGSQELINGLGGLLTNADKISQIEIFITHFHMTMYKHLLDLYRKRKSLSTFISIWTL